MHKWLEPTEPPAALPDARSDPCDELGQNLRGSGRFGTADILGSLHAVERSRANAAVRDGVTRVARRVFRVQQTRRAIASDVA